MKVDIDKLIATMDCSDRVLRQEVFEFSEDERKVISISLRILKQAIGRGPFITGAVGERDQIGLYDGYLICPSLGLDGFALYQKSGEYTAPGW